MQYSHLQLLPQSNETLKPTHTTTRRDQTSNSFKNINGRPSTNKQSHNTPRIPPYLPLYTILQYMVTHKNNTPKYLDPSSQLAHQVTDLELQPQIE